jgi:Protein of unknown function (DUF1566)/Collagen triple helix repeat (20 copies)
MRTLATLTIFVLLDLASHPSEAIGLPVVISATVDYSHNTLTINGQNFGSAPAVKLDALAFATATSGTSQIVANFPSGKAPSSFIPGTYFLTVTFKNQLPTVFAVDIGGSGAQGPAGPAGAPGAPGAAGGTGSAGPAGPQGIPGPMGPPGAMGATGPQGLRGVAGPVGPQGLQGATGPQGPAGAGGGLPSCTVPDVAVLYNGAFICKSAVPHYVDNGDGTITDNTTGLMWEKKTGVLGPFGGNISDVHDVNNQYSWSSTDNLNLPNGSLYTEFLLALNDIVRTSVLFGATNCFANHCDWRIPEVGELRTIISTDSSCVSSANPCIDPIFGPTRQAPNYWSNTSDISNPLGAWAVNFYGGSSQEQGKGLGAARAVRFAR